MSSTDYPHNGPEETEANLAHLRDLLALHGEIEERLRQAMLIELHSRGLVSIDDLYQEARTRARHVVAEESLPVDDNVQVARRWDEDEKRHIQDLTLEHLAEALTRDEIDDLVNLTRKRERAHSLEEIARLGTVSFGVLARKVRAFCRLPMGHTTLPEEDSVSVRLALIRQLISEQLEFQSVAKRYLWIRDFDDLVDRIVGDDQGSGRIGGKAAGLVLGAKILSQARREDPRAPKLPLATPESFYLRSDAMEQFIGHNGLNQLQDHKYRDLDEIRNDYPVLLEIMKNASFPPVVVERLGQVLDRVGTHPLIVRSSSLLEDRFGTTFAGKYRSVFVGNQGSREERLTELLGAIAEVYASSLHPDPIRYRKRHGLLDFDENMAVLIQKIVGRRVGRFFLPVWAGVAFSRNPYRRNPRIRPEDGMARVVFGLGTRAVDRVGSDTPRVIPLGLPALRPEVKAADIVAAAQSQVDVLDLERNRFVKRPAGDVLDAAAGMPGLGMVCSTVQHGVMRPLVGDGLMADPAEMVVTFDRFAQSSPYPAMLRWCVQTLERAYGCPVDIEFAFDGDRLHLLQCRPQAVRAASERVQLPEDVAAGDQVFSASRDVINGSVPDLEYVVLIDPRDYNALPDDQSRICVAQVVRRLNRALEGRRFALLGPGRWGSRDLRLGVRVTYSDVDNTRLLVEIARSQSGYTPEVSFGSHFFQDLVESDIHYLALYPDEPGAVFDEGLLHGAPNRLAELLPGDAPFADVVRVIHVPSETGGRVLRVDLDEGRQRALGYLTVRQEEPAPA